VFSLAAVAADVVEFYEAVALEADLTVEVRGDAQLQFDAPLMRRALSNLLSNATRYAASGSRIVIQIGTQAQHGHTEAVISVTNTGADIAPSTCAICSTASTGRIPHVTTQTATTVWAWPS
jgi:two-component system heavy metal sensor histidine kinase CusS